MLDIYIWLSILVAAVLGEVIYAIANRKRQRPNLSLHVAPTRYQYNPGVTIVETNSGFSEGMVAGAMYAQQRPVVDETTPPQYQAVQGDPSAAAPFAGFSGGDSDGGGATSDWSSSSDSSSCDTSSSSCDSGPSDSGSSGGDY